jgi:phage gpG-like protein
VRHRTNAKGELLRSAHLGGKGLIFAKNSHKRAVARWFEQGAHSITMPARPFLGISLQGELKIVRAAGKYLASVIP